MGVGPISFWFIDLGREDFWRKSTPKVDSPIGSILKELAGAKTFWSRPEKLYAVICCDYSLGKISVCHDIPI